MQARSSIYSFTKLFEDSFSQNFSEYDQEIPQSHIADQPTAP